MPHTKCKEVYFFDELSETAKEKAREWYRHGALDYEWWEAVYEDAATIAKLMGLDIRHRAAKLMGGGTRYEPSVYFSGFHSQGDGAYFEGTWKASDVKPGAVKKYAPQEFKLHRIATIFEEIAEACPGASFSCKHSGRYSHSHSTSFDVSFSDDPLEDMEYGSPEYKERDEELLQIEEQLIETARDFMNWIYQLLEKEHDYLLADEQVDETIKANEYEFTEDGRRA